MTITYPFSGIFEFAGGTLGTGRYRPSPTNRGSSANDRSRYSHSVPRVLRDDSGATLVEFAIALAVFLLIFFGLIDFRQARLQLRYGGEGDAAGGANRGRASAGVRWGADGIERPVLAPGLRRRGSEPIAAPAQTSASIPGTITCAARRSPPPPSRFGPDSGAHAGRRDDRQPPLLLRLRRQSRLPRWSIRPIVTAELQDLTFSFISPLGALAALAGRAGRRALVRPSRSPR